MSNNPTLEKILIVVGCALMMQTGNVIKIMFDMYLNVPFKMKQAVLRTLLCLVIGACVGYFSILQGSNPTKQSTPFLLLILSGFFLIVILQAIEKEGPSALLDKVFGFIGLKRIDKPPPTTPPVVPQA